MVTLIVSAVVGLIALVGGGYLGYRWGRKVEAGVQAAILAAKAGAGAVVAAAKQ